MFFKNLTVYRLPVGWKLPERGTELALTPVPSMDPLTRRASGFVPPTPFSVMAYGWEGRAMVALAVDEKLLPAAIVKQETEKVAAELAEVQGFPVGRRQKRELREAVEGDMLKVALTRRRVTRALIDPVDGWLIVDTPSFSRADEVVSELRGVFGTFAVTYFGADKSPRTDMGLWLRNDNAAPAGFRTEEPLELQATGRTGATVKYAREAPTSDEVIPHLNAGKVVTQLGLVWRGRLAFRLNDQAQVKRVEFLDLASDPNVTDPQERFQNDFALMVLTFAELLGGLDTALRRV